MGDDEAPAVVVVEGEADAADGVPAQPRRRPRLRVAWLVAGLVVLALAAPVVVVQAAGRTHSRALADVPQTPVALVLGAGLRPDGSPSTYLRRRLDAARSLYEAGTVRVILVSGDNGT